MAFLSMNSQPKELSQENEIIHCAQLQCDSLIAEFGLRLENDFRKFELILDVQHPANGGYKYFPVSAVHIVESYDDKSTDRQRENFLRFIILKFIIKTLRRRVVERLPPTLRVNQIDNFYRIISDDFRSMNWLCLDNDLFQKEFGLASERLYAVGAQVLEPWCGVARSILFRSGLISTFKFALFFYKAGGFKDYVQIHIHKFNLNKFSEAGREACYRGCVELYDVIPGLRGMFGSSWFYDPATEDFCPHLSYLWKTPLNAGAIVAFYSSGGQAIGNATSTSTKRRLLYESGKFLPKNFMLVWRAKDQKEWLRLKDLENNIS